MQPITRPEEAAARKFSFPEPEELSPPILRLEGAATGYQQKPVLQNMNLRIDQDDRIALLGRNGEGKSTLSKLLSGRLDLLDGHMHMTSKLRVGYFAQHQVDELRIEETPLDHLRRARDGDVPQSKLRAQLGGFGIGADQAETAVGQLSGGQKARLSLMLATLDAPHMLILDEPTNHLDIESRESLIEALTVYSGAVILVSHDMHLLELVADRLWLVHDGTVSPYDDDLQSYRSMLLDLKPPAGRNRAKSKKPAPPDRFSLLALRDEVRKCEARLEKLDEMRQKISAKLADPSLYEEARLADRRSWERKYTEVTDGLDRAEALWIDAVERLEAAQALA